MKTSMAAMKGPLFRFSLLVVVAAIACTTPANFATAATSESCTVRPFPPDAEVVKYHFDIQSVNYTVNCHTKSILTVNGMFPGPIIYAKEGDRVIVNVTNSSPADMTIHFHGIRQVKSPWMDGVDAVSMCPIKAGDYFVHDFIVPNQQGTLLWHAHIGWQRATIHGAFITHPVKNWNRAPRPGADPVTKWYPNLANRPYPFAKPEKEFPIIIAEWWYKDVEEVEETGIETGGIFPTSDAVTINGHPGPFYNCSAQSNTPQGNNIEEITTFKVKKGKTYLLRIVNAATNMHTFLSVGNHTLTVVEADGEYVQPFKTSIVFASPGQTVTALITADQEPGIYTMEVGGYGRDPITGEPAALFKYDKEPYSPDLTPVHRPTLPNYKDTDEVYNFTNSLRTLYPGRVPLTVDRHIFMPVGLSRRPCDETPVVNTSYCPSGLRAQAEVTNITFLLPTIALMQASFENIPGVFVENFPDQPSDRWNYTGSSPPAPDTVSSGGTRVIPVTFNQTVEVVLQDTSVLGIEDHPFHLHGHNFYILAQGPGNYNAETVSLNLNDPVLRNTVSVPAGGWAVIRFKANNPGMWLFHCHLDKHVSWGMMAVFHIHNGEDPDYKYNCPPERLMPCS